MYRLIIAEDERFVRKERTKSISKKRKRLKKGQKRLLLLVLPFVAYFVIFSYIPIAGWALAFMNYKPGINCRSRGQRSWDFGKGRGNFCLDKL